MAPRVAMVTSRHIATISCSHAVIFSSSSSSSVPVCLSLALTSPLTRQRFDMGHVCESCHSNQTKWIFFLAAEWFHFWDIYEPDQGLSCQRS